MPQQHGTVENKRATTEGKKDEKKEQLASSRSGEGTSLSHR